MKNYPRFTYRDFLGMNRSNEIIRWLNDRGAKHLGCGASRHVYRISPKRVIKVEYSLYYGKSQNKHEVQKSDQFGDTGLVAKCYWYHPSYVWIISEFAERVQSDRKYWKWHNDNSAKFSAMKIADIGKCNVGAIGNRFVLVDLGLGWD